MYGIYLIVVLVALAWRVAPPSAGFLPRLPSRAAGAIYLGAAAALAASVLVQLHVDSMQAAHNRPWRDVRLVLPVPVIGDGTASMFTSDARFWLATIQTLLLGALLFAGRAVRAQDRKVAIASTVLLAGIALAACVRAPELSSNDVYAYIGQARTAGSPYRPAAVALPGDDVAIGKVWGTPVVASPYGPLWVGLSELVARVSSALGEQVVAFRVVGAVGLLGCLGALIVRGVPWWTASAFALNPMLLEQYVVDAHNDVVGIALVLAAAVTRRAWLATALVVAAADVKWTFLVVGVVALARGELAVRCRSILTAVALTIASYATFAGRDYLIAVREASRLFSPPSIGVTALHVSAAAIAVGAVALFAFDRTRALGGASWSFVAFGFAPLPWYLGLGVPFALATDVAASFLASLPLMAMLGSTTFLATPGLYATMVAVACGATTWLLIGMSRRFRRAREVGRATV